MLFRKKVSDHKPKPEDEFWGAAPQKSQLVKHFHKHLELLLKNKKWTIMTPLMGMSLFLQKK
ncbi:MAG: hypothetical protein ACK5H8_19175, partial [Pseudanabaena sp.]